MGDNMRDTTRAKQLKATEAAMCTLHGTVAKVLDKQINHTEAEMTFDEDGVPTPTGKHVHTASPATISAAIKFLKDNSITCDVEQEENMNNLRDTLAKKQRRSRLGDAGVAALSIVED